MKFSLDQLRALAASVGFPDPDLAASVAMAESHIPGTDLADSCAQGDPLGPFSCDGPNGTSKSFGLWQIHVGFNPQYDPKSLLDPTYNARAALAISKNGATWLPWSAFKNGSYLRWYQHAVYPPNGGQPIIPQPVTPPPKPTRVVAATIGVLALVAAAGYGAYEFARRSRPTPQPIPYPAPIPPYSTGRFQYSGER